MKARPAASPARARRPPSGRRGAARWAGRALLAAAVLAAYAPALSNGLVWDDRQHIVDNPRLRGVTTAAAAYVPRLEGAYHRPAVFLAYAVEHAAWGANPLGYHLTNLLLHLANTLLLVSVARRTGVSEPAALLGAAAFALHPVQTEAVAYVSGRTDLLMTAGALASCRVLLGGRPAAARGAGAALLGAAAMLSKETGYALVALWPWLAWRHARDAGQRIGLAAPGVIAGLALLAARPGELPQTAPAVTVGRLAGVGQALLAYAGVLAWPTDLQVDRLTPLPAGGAAVAAGLAALAGAVALAAYGLSRRGASGDWTAWTVAFYLPAANLLALYPAITDRAYFTPEHNLYAPLAGAAVLAALGCERVAAACAPRLRRALWAAPIALLLTWAGLGAARCRDWRAEERLFGGAVAAGSPSPRVWYNYGNSLLARGDADAAVSAFAGAAERAPNDAAIWTNLGVARQRQRRYDDAERAYRRAAELAPGDALIVENLGTLLLARGDVAGARRAFIAALRIDPQRSTARRALAAIDRATP